jgi:hypothetical protein
VCQTAEKYGPADQGRIHQVIEVPVTNIILKNLITIELKIEYASTTYEEMKDDDLMILFIRTTISQKLNIPETSVLLVFILKTKFLQQTIFASLSILHHVSAYLFIYFNHTYLNVIMQFNIYFVQLHWKHYHRIAAVTFVSNPIT